MSISLLNKTQQIVVQSDFPISRFFQQCTDIPVLHIQARWMVLTDDQEIVRLMSMPLSGENDTRTDGKAIELKQSAFPIAAERLWNLTLQIHPGTEIVGYPD